jgi:hypothetical protein
MVLLKNIKYVFEIVRVYASARNMALWFIRSVNLPGAH